LLDYVNKRRQNGHQQLWDLEPDSRGYWSGLMSKRYRHIFKTAGITASFHSWRHTVCDTLMKDPDIRKEEQEGLVGHTIGGESMNRYGKGLSLITLKHTVEAIKYEGLNLQNLTK